MSYNILNNTSLKGLTVWIQCTWVRVFTEPVIDKGICIRSYDRIIAKNTNIGTLTGNHYTDEKGFIWVEANLLFCDRRPTGWFREKDIWHSLKGTPANPLDLPYITKAETKKAAWLGWLTGGITLLSFLH